MKILLPIATVLLLSGCAAGMNEDFSCSGIDGISGCVSMTDLNSMVDDGQFNTTAKAILSPTRPRQQRRWQTHSPLRPSIHRRCQGNLFVLKKMSDK